MCSQLPAPSAPVGRGESRLFELDLLRSPQPEETMAERRSGFVAQCPLAQRPR